MAAARLGAPPPRRATIRRDHNGRAHQVLIEPPSNRANGHATRSSERPTWSLEELGQAAHGVPPIHFAAACYAYAGDRSVYWQLWQALNFTIARLAGRNNWPAQVRGDRGQEPHFYFASLAQLVLDEDANPHIFAAAPALYALCMAVDLEVWERQLFERFDAVRLTFHEWIGNAMRVIQPRLEELADSGD